MAFFLVAQPVFSSWRLGGGGGVGRGGEVAQMPRFNGSSSALFLLRINITFVGLFGAFKMPWTAKCTLVMVMVAASM